MGFKEYEYLVAYHYSGEGYLTPCTGTTLISRKKKIKTIEDILELNKYIEGKIEGASNLGIYNFILLGRKRYPNEKS